MAILLSGEEHKITHTPTLTHKEKKKFNIRNIAFIPVMLVITSVRVSIKRKRGIVAKESACVRVVVTVCIVVVSPHTRWIPESKN